MKSIPDFLRELPGVFTANRAPSATRASLPFTGVAGGIPEGAITEISGPPGGGKTEVLLKFLSENPDTRVAWIEERFTAYPCAFVQSGVRLERVLFVEASPSEGMWAVLQCLRSQAFEIVVYFGAATMTRSRFGSVTSVARNDRMSADCSVIEPRVVVRPRRAQGEEPLPLNILHRIGQTSGG
ncbi:MAG: hypothetical protein ACXWP5_16765 [Bdellovibrionota bacterium]